MEIFKNKANILWDFDGVIIDSMSIRGEGFKEVLSHYPNSTVEELLEYHNKNGGLSRYVKFRYFIKEILGKSVNEEMIQDFAASYSKIMRTKLTSKRLLNVKVLDFIKSNQKKFKMHIVSGSDGKELRFLCKKLEIREYFKSIEGSPTPKTKLVSELITQYNYASDETCLIGDSINDYDAAKENQIDFYAYNNEELRLKCHTYIDEFTTEKSF